MLLTSLPAFQKWGAGVASNMLTEKTGGKVSIASLRLNMLGHVILDSVKLYDQRDTLMLQASRIAARVDIMPLVEKKIRISGAQLIGAKAKLYKDGEEPCNFQFLLDAFSSKDTTSSPLNLGIKALVIRRGDVSFDRIDKPTTPGKFNLGHLHLTDISLTARFLARMPDTLAINVRKLSLQEQSGLCLKQLSFEAKVGPQSASLQDLQIELPNSSIFVKCLMSDAPFLAGKKEKIRLEALRGAGFVTAHVCPSDLACLMPKLKTFNDVISTSSEFELKNGSLQFPYLACGDNGSNLTLICDATISDIQSNPSVFADIKELRTGPSLQQFLTLNLQGQAKEVHPILSRLGSTKTTGSIDYQDKNLRTNLITESEQGTVSLDATLRNMQDIEADIIAIDVRLGHLLNLPEKARATTASIETTVTGTLPKEDKKPKLMATGILNSLAYKDYRYRDVHFSAQIDGEAYGAEVLMEEPNSLAQIQVGSMMQQGRRTLQCQAHLKDFTIPYNLSKASTEEDADPLSPIDDDEGQGWTCSGKIDADFSNIDPNHLQGELKLNGLKLISSERGTLDLGDAVLTSNVTEKGMHLRLNSDFLTMTADGDIRWKTIPASVMLPIRENLPNLFLFSDRQPEATGNDFRFFVQVEDTLLLGQLLNTELHVAEKSIVEGSINDAIGQFAIQMNIPELKIAGQQLQNLYCRTEAGNASLQTSLQCERIMKGKPVELNIDAYAANNKVTSRLRWDNKRQAAYTGDISMTGTILRDLLGQTAIEAKMNTSRIVIGDTLWHIKPAIIKYHDKVVDVEDLSISQGKRHVNIGGRISDLASDTLKAELADIDISYIMDLVNFHSVDFDGKATGSIYATSLLKKPFADAFLQVKDFTFNEADLGDMDLYANWGKQKRAILLNADMRGHAALHRTQLQGTIIPGKGVDDGLNLNIQTSHIDLSFLNKFTKDVFRNLQGSASGWARVFGPFKEVNLEGDMFINEMKMHVLALGTDYRLAGDSIILRADNIWLRGARVYDRIGVPGVSEHMATVDAHLMHDALKDMRFDINIDASNMLCYNFPHQGSMNFFGTVYADAQAHLSGEPGTVNIDVAADPMPGTTITYNIATPETVSEADFVTYGSLSPSTSDEEGEGGNDQNKLTPSLQGKGEGDMRINLRIDANPNAQIRLLMDPRTGDNITLQGNGLLTANYYNKGRFQLYGTYRVSDGTYNMSIQDLIRKDFTFMPDGTIVFGGDAMQASLNLTAKHTVLNVSLDDLSTTGLGLSNTRVDCIMNIGGMARDPVISFDFDIPNANEDEKQMVRSMLSSEEERDMQTIYLLGVGRFYTYGTLEDKKQTKSGMAMNSVLSSALTSRFNQIMSQALGGSNWSFGTNLQTGESGWEHVDVEGMLSGKMFSGRLQFNGNFGYRENKYKVNGNNFIGDFDIQYRLSPRSPFSLKAYNQTNDRYFTQSSLTTQGIGIKFQRDFSRWQELFMRTKEKKKK